MLSYCTWAEDAASTKTQKENWLVSGLKDHRYLSVTRVRHRGASGQATNTQSNGSQRYVMNHRPPPSQHSTAQHRGITLSSGDLPVRPWLARHHRLGSGQGHAPTFTSASPDMRGLPCCARSVFGLMPPEFRKGDPQMCQQTPCAACPTAGSLTLRRTLCDFHNTLRARHAVALYRPKDSSIILKIRGILIFVLGVLNQ